MPTPLDRALSSKNALLGFAGIVTAVAAWNIWSGDIFPPEGDPTGDPDKWSEDEMRRWLNRRNLMADPKANKEQLLERIKANSRPKN